MNSLPPPDCHYHQAAQGWLELGNLTEASNELERLAPEFRSHPEVLEIRWHIHAQGKKWDACIDLASSIINLHPDQAVGWIHRSFALHELKRTQEAFDQLLPAADKFPGIWIIPYNLACYSAQLGSLSQCQKWFKKAARIDEQAAKRAGMDDPDLKPFWDKLNRSFRQGTG